MKLYDILGANGMERAVKTAEAVRDLRQLGSFHDFTSSPLADAKWLAEWSQEWLAMLKGDVEFTPTKDIGKDLPLI